MTRAEAIERAKIALEDRTFAQIANMPMLRSQGFPYEVSEAEKSIRLDTEALQALREWKPEEKIFIEDKDPMEDMIEDWHKRNDSAPTGEGREE